MLAENRDVLDLLAAELMEHETLEAERVQELFTDVRHFERTGAGAGRRVVRRPDSAATDHAARPAPAASPPDEPRRSPPRRTLEAPS